MHVDIRLELWTTITTAFVVIILLAIVMRWAWVRQRNTYHNLVNELHRLATMADEKSIGHMDWHDENMAQCAHGVSIGLQFAAMEVRHYLLDGPKPLIYGWEKSDGRDKTADDMPRPEEIGIAFITRMLRGRATLAEHALIMKGVTMTIGEREAGTHDPLTLQAHCFALGGLYQSTWLEKTHSGADNVLKRIRDILELQSGQSTIETVYRLKHADDVARNRAEEGRKEGEG